MPIGTSPGGGGRCAAAAVAAVAAESTAGDGAQGAPGGISGGSCGACMPSAPTCRFISYSTSSSPMMRKHVLQRKTRKLGYPNACVSRKGLEHPGDTALTAVRQSYMNVFQVNAVSPEGPKILGL